MSYKINEQRTQTMLQRIGEAAELIDDQRFLPFYRGVQIKLEKEGRAEEWSNMIKSAQSKTNPKRYFAKLCKMVRDGTYKFVQVVAEVKKEVKLYIHDKLVKYNFGNYQKYWVRKAQEYVNINGMGSFTTLLEYSERKKVGQKYLARAIANCKPPEEYYRTVLLNKKGS